MHHTTSVMEAGKTSDMPGQKTVDSDRLIQADIFASEQPAKAKIKFSPGCRARPGFKKIFANDSPNEYFLRQNDDLFATIIYLCVHILLTYIISTDFPIASFIVFVQYLHDTRYKPFVQFAYCKL